MQSFLNGLLRSPKNYALMLFKLYRKSANTCSHVSSQYICAYKISLHLISTSSLDKQLF